MNTNKYILMYPNLDQLWLKTIPHSSEFYTLPKILCVSFEPRVLNLHQKNYTTVIVTIYKKNICLNFYYPKNNLLILLILQKF